MAQRGAAEQRGPWAQQGIDLVAAASGGLLFGIPMLMTMEVWWVGSHTTPTQVLTVLGLILVLMFVLNHTEGFRSTRDVRLRDALTDSVEALALGLLLTTAVLVLLREIRPDTPALVAIGKAAYEAIPFCLGIGLARHFLRGDGSAEEETDGRTGIDGQDRRINATLADLGATAMGAVFVSLNIAPTDEVPTLAAALGPIGVAAVAVASLVVSYAIVFVAEFGRQSERHAHEGVLQRPIAETIAAYLVALVCAAVMLGTLQRMGGPWPSNVDEIIVLGLPASIGGAAGRLAV